MLFKNKKVFYAAIAVVIVAVAAVLVLFSTQQGSGNTAIAASDNKQVPVSLLAKLAVPNNVSRSIGLGAADEKSLEKLNNQSPLMANGKPEVLYIGAEYCPYCAAQRWAMYIALSRFGTFSNLRYMTSSSTDYPPSIPTFTFHNTTYSSPYIAFVPIETTTNTRVNGTYPTLQMPNASENVTFAAYNSGGSIPFVDFGNKTVEIGAMYLPTTLQGMNWTQVADQLNNPSSAVAQGIVGSANLFTAQICNMDNNQPQNVCGQAYIQDLESA